MSNDYNSDNIESWLQGELPENERREFEKQLQSDPDLALEVKLQQDLSKALSEEDAFQFRNALKTAHREYQAENTEGAKVLEFKPEERSRIFPIRRLLAIAAGVALLVTAGIWMLNQPGNVTPDTIYAANFVPPSSVNFAAETGIKGDPSSPETSPLQKLRKDALDAYNRKDYPAALGLLEKIPAGELTPDELRQHYYQQGVLYLITGNYSKANELLSMENAAEAESRQWYRALVLLKQKAPKATLEAAFSEMANSKTHAWQKEAQAVLKQIEKME